MVEALAEMFPQADLFALIADPALCKATLNAHRVTTSFLQKLPRVTRHYRKLLALFPYALEQFDLQGYDLVLSSESGPAKGVLTSPRTCHICYCHSPMRYLWDLYHQYRSGKRLGRLSRALFSLSAHYVRMWDVASASRVDYFVANSQNVARRIRKHYRRDSTVIYPPVEVSAGSISETVNDYYLVVSQLVEYKRVDLAIEACNRLRRPLKIIGDGEEYKRLRRLAGPTVEFLGFLPDPEVRERYAHCRALLFPGEEDFGMVPVEAQAFGRPVIAFGQGGALESVVSNFDGGTFDPQSSTGIFFSEQSVDSLVQALQLFESVEARFSRAFIRKHSERFDASCFRSAMSSFIQLKLDEFRAAGAMTPI